MNRRILMLVAVALLLTGGIAAACSSDTEDLEEDIQALGTQVEELHAASQNGDVLASLTALQEAALHELNDAVNEGELPEGSTGQIDRAIRAMAITWPEELQPIADETLAALHDAATAIDSGDATVAQDPVRIAHAAWHDLDHQASNWLTGEEMDMDMEGEEGDHSEDMDMESEETADEGAAE